MSNTSMEAALKHIPNRFELTLCATYRARQILRHAPEGLPAMEKNKACVDALQEIANGEVGKEMLLKAPLH